VGSYCPEKSINQVFFIPILLVIGLDLLITAALVWYFIHKRFRSTRESHARPKGISAISAAMTGYKELPDENENDHDQEMLPMNATYMPPRMDTWTGFEAALDIPIPVNSLDTEVYELGLTPEVKAFVDSMRKATDASQFGLSFTYTNLSFQPKGAPRPILQNVTGSIERGSLTAVMGGSGAGKSTFVNVLMGKTTNTGGLVTVNNIPGKIKRYKKLIGYVPQDDIVLPELTVYENILHSARIRLPRTWADVDIKAHVNSVIDCLELSHVRNSLVGSVGKPVISGGQRKRVSIGMELAAAPMAIFLDEPTSGLDATSASSIMRTLKAIARLGISVIVIIHQPRMEIFEILDELILLGNGQIIYEGTGNGVQDFFETIGFQFPPHSNVGDVITDIITGNGRVYKKAGDISKEALIAHWASSRQNASIKSRHESMQPDRASVKITTTIHRELLKQRGAPRWKQGWLCLQRAMLQQWRAKSSFWFEMGLATLSGILLGLAENSKKGILFTGIYNAPFEVLSIAADFKSVPELALLTAIAIGLVSGAPGVKVFSEEMLLYRREAEAGHSRIAYFLAKNLSVLPRMVFACLHFSTLILVLAAPVIPWGIAFLTNLVYFYCIYGLASVISSKSTL
jgi:ABC-type multidrug transport system ATPase subunit